MKPKRWVSLLLVLFTALCLMPTKAFAADWAYVKKADGTETRYSTFPEAWNAATSGDKNTVGLLNNWDGGRFVVPEGKTVTLELNGYVLTRDLGDQKSDGEVLYVSKNARLNVYGGNQENPSEGSDKSHSVNVYVANADRYGYTRRKETLYGGIVNGGNSSDAGGGIHMKEGAKAYLYNVTIAGNRAGAKTVEFGDGGGIEMDNSYGYLYMQDSQVIYNCARYDGGGVHVDQSYCRIEMVRSRIDHNVADDNGGGIYVDGNHFILKGDAKQIMDPEGAISDYGIKDWTGAYNYFPPVEEIGSSISYNCVFDAEDGGGGIYCDNQTELIQGVNIFGNIAINTDDNDHGGGIYLNEEEMTVRNCNIFRNKADKLGGGIYNRGDDNIIDRDDNTVDSCSIVMNVARATGGAGGGIYVYRYCDLGVSGPTIVRGNVSNGLADDNLYLSSDGAAVNAYLIPSTAPGADIHVRLSTAGASGHGDQISRDAGSYDIQHFAYDNDSNKHIGWDRKWSDRVLKVVDGAKPAKAEAVVFTPDSGKRTQVIGGGYNGYELIKGIVSYPSFPDEDADIENVFYYSDGFFANDTNTYNLQLGTLSMCLAGAAGYSNEYGKDDAAGSYLDKSQNFRQFVSDIGCADADIYVNDFNTQKPGADTIGVGIASKDMVIGDVTKKLVIIGVRGMGYEKEWISNLTLGAEGEASGWSSAATQVMAELNDYLSRKGINGRDSNTIFWIAGYSRAGATANLTAKRIVDTYDTQGTHTFAYPLEAPKGGVESAKVDGNNYNCIHNIVNNNDIVPWVGTTEMGLIRYGVDHYVPGSTDISANPTDHDDANKVPMKNNIPEDNVPWDVEDTLHHGYTGQKEKMLAQLTAVNQDILFDDYYQQATIKYVEGGKIGSTNLIEETSDHENEIGTTEHFVGFFFEKLQEYAFKYNTDGKTDGVPTNPRGYFSTYKLNGMTFQQAAGSAAGVVFGMPAERKDGLIDSMNGLMDRLDNTLAFYRALDEGGIKDGELLANLKKIWKQLTDPSSENIAKGARSIKDFLTTEEFTTLDNGYVSLLFPILCFVGMDYDKYGQDVVGSAAYNIPRIIANHYPEVTHAWLRSYDELYANDTTPVVMDPSVKTEPSVANLVISHADGSEETVVALDSAKTGENAIKYKIDDVVRLVPSNDADVNVGEAIYYQFTDGHLYYDRTTHLYHDPIAIEDIDRDYAVNGVISFRVATAHDGTKSDWVPVQLALAGNATVSIPGGYADGEIQYMEEPLEKNKSLVFDTTVSTGDAIPDLEELGYAFMGWKVYQYTPTGDYSTSGTVGEEISPSKYAEYFGGGFNASSKSTTVTNLKGINARFVPVLEPAIDASLVFGAGGDDLIETYTNKYTNGLPAYAKWKADGGDYSDNHAILWEYDQSNNRYIGTVNFVVDSNAKHFRVNSIAFEETSTSFYKVDIPTNVTSSTVSKSATGDNVATVVVTFTPKSTSIVENTNAESEEPADTSEILNAESEEPADTSEILNAESEEPADAAESTTAESEESTETSGSLDADSEESADATGSLAAESKESTETAESLIADDNYGDVYTCDNNLSANITEYRVAILRGTGIIGLHGTLVAPVVDGMKFEKWVINGYGDQDVTADGYEDKITAFYHPVVSAAEVVLDKPLEAGKTMPEPEKAQTVVTVTNRWKIDNAAFAWDSTDKTANYDKAYSASITVNPKEITGTNLDDPGSQSSVSLSGAFEFADELDIKVTDADGNAINAANSMYLSEEGNLVLKLDFDKTAKASIVGFEDVSIIVPHGSTREDILSKLPTDVNAYLEDGLMVSVPVTWSNIYDYNPSAENMQIVTASGQYTGEEHPIAQGVELTASVTVLGLDQTATPEATPGSGDYRGVQKIRLTADEGATIWYAVKTALASEYYTTTVDPVTGETTRKANPDKKPKPETADYAQYTEPVTLNQYDDVVFFLYAYAVKEGLANSDTADYTYLLTKPEVTKLEAKNEKIAEDGNIECWYSKKRSGYEADGTPIYDGDPDQYYANEACTELLDYDTQVRKPAFISTSHDAAETDAVATCINQKEWETVVYNGLETLGVQAIGTDGTEARVLTVLDARIIDAATDYGYLFGTDKDSLTYDAAQYQYSCKDTSNGLYSGDYLYVTAKIANGFLNPNMKACFYVKLENGTDYIYTDAVSCEATIGRSDATDEARDNIIADDAKAIPEFKSHTLLLSGEIGVNFYADLSMLTDAEKQAATMEFTVSGKTKTDTFDANCVNPSGDEYYGFTCFINSVQMADEITAELHYTQDGKSGSVSQTYSAKDYVDYVLGHTDDYSANAVALVEAIADYGHYVQPFLATTNGWTIGTNHVAMEGASLFSEDDVTAARTGVADKTVVRDVGESQIEKVTYALNLESETAIRIYLKVKDGYEGAVTATVGGEAIDCVKQSDGRYRIEIGGISAHKLGDVYNITVNADGACTIGVSALSYVDSALNSDNSVFTNDDAHYAVTALYKYYVATMAYKDNPNS